MKLKIVSVIIGLYILSSSCDKYTCGFSTGIVGEWKLVEELMDPGDGSGTFQPVSSTKKIEFFDDGTFEANGEMCSMTNQSGTNHDGVYSTSTGILNPDNCASTQPLNITYTLSADTLILNYPCFEGCAQKYYRN
jgi:Lipocalin-like domain